MKKTSKKKKKGLRLALLALLIVVLAGTYVLLVMHNNKQAIQKVDDNGKSEYDALISMNSDDITYIAYENENGLLEFSRKDEDNWTIAQAPDMPVKSYPVSTLLSSVSAVAPTDVIADTLDDMATYGLDDPTYTLTVKNSDGTSVTLYLGKKNAYSNTYYAYAEGDSHVYMVSYTLAQRMDKTLYDYCDASQTAFSSDSAVYAERIENGSTVYALQKYDSARMDITWFRSYYWYLTDASGKCQVADGSYCSDFLEALGSISAGDCIDYTSDESRLAEYGLDEANAIRFDLVSNDGTEDTESTYWFGKQAEDGQYYFRCAESDGIFLVDQSDTEALLAYQDRDFWTRGFSIINIDDVNSVDVITSDGQSLTLSIERTEQEVEEETTDSTDESAGTTTEVVCTYYRNGKECDESDFKNLYQTIISVYGDRAMTAEESPVDVDPSVTVVFHTSLESFPEVTIEYTYFNSNFFEATVNGETQMLVNRNSITSLLEIFDTEE